MSLSGLTIRHRVLVEGIPQRQIARETGISPKTIRKMLAHPHPQPYGPRSHRYPKLGPHTASIRRMLQENATLPPTARLSVQAMYERIRDQEGFGGSYGAVKDYVRPIPRDQVCIWEYAYDHSDLAGQEAGHRFPVPPVPRRSAGDLVRPRRAVLPRCWADRHNSSKAGQAREAKRAAFEWMRAVLQKEISDEELRREVGDLPELAPLLQRLYDGRLSDRNRSMVVLAKQRDLGKRVVCAFLSIDKKTYLKYLRLFKHGGTAALFARQTKSSRKFDDEALKKAVFSLLHEPPSNYGINRTSWKMPTSAGSCARKGGRPALR